MPAYPTRELSVTYSTSSRSFTGGLGIPQFNVFCQELLFCRNCAEFGMAGNKAFWEEVSKLPKLPISHFWRKG